MIDFDQPAKHIENLPVFVTTEASARPHPVPDHLRDALAPAQVIMHEWVPYQLRFPQATHIRVGSARQEADVMADYDGVPHGHFRVSFENQLGLTSITPIRGDTPCGDSINVEVIAGKFPTVDHSLDFLQGTLADLFSRGTTLPFVTSSTTGRGIRDAYLAPNDLFAFHFFRHRGDEIVRATQAILGGPHRVLDDEPELVRVHEVRHMDRDTIRHMLQTSIQRRGTTTMPRAGSAVQRLQPERVMQRLPIESYDTPENRFIVTACRRMISALDRIDRARWFRTGTISEADKDRLREVHQHLRHITTDPRFAMLEPSVRVPSHSRVLQRRGGYRELTLLWNDLHRTREPVFEAMEHAIDLRDVATLYEFWLLFELIDLIKTSTGIDPILVTAFEALGHPTGTFEARFPGAGKLFYQRGFRAPRIYSGITLKPDFVWERIDSRRIVMDAKFRLQYPWPKDGENDAQESLKQTRAKTDDIAKMHAYRDAIEGVSAAIVLYPGTSSDFRTTDGTSRDLTIDDIITGDLHGIGSIAMSPLQTRDMNEGAAADG